MPKLSMIDHIRQHRIPLVMCILAALICLGYSTFRSQMAPWWRLVGGGIPYVAFWIFLWFTILPRRRLIPHICVVVVLVTCLLEVMQLWNPEPLASIRKTKLGLALLGNTFQWPDFPPYLIGGIVGFFSLRTIAKNEDH